MTNYRTKRGREILIKTIDRYFKDCDTVNENEKKVIKPYTLSGMLFSLGITSSELEELCEIRQLRRVITEAKLKIESHIEENALNGRLSGTAAINSLKCNFGWNDKSEKDGGIKNFSVTLDENADKLGI